MVDTGDGSYKKSFGQLVNEMTSYYVDHSNFIKKEKEPYYSAHQKHIEAIDEFVSDLESKIANLESNVVNLEKRKPISEARFGHGGATGN